MNKESRIGAYGLIILNDEIVLIKKRNGAYKGKLDLPGGGIEHSETPEECVKREIKEETNLDVLDSKLLDVFSVRVEWSYKEYEENLHHIGIIYLIKSKGIPSELGDDKDSLGSSWYKISNLKKENLSPFTIMGLEKLNYKLK